MPAAHVVRQANGILVCGICGATLTRTGRHKSYRTGTQARANMRDAHERAKEGKTG